MVPFSFSKYHGLGNDFLIFDDRSSFFPSQDKENIAKICRRNRGVGADGILLLQKSASEDFCMRIFNRDGNEAACSGNGLLCLLQYLKDSNLVKERCRIETMRGKVEGGYQDDRIYVIMPHPRIYQLSLPIEVDGRTIELSWLDSGVPHVVHFVEDPSTVNLKKLGRFLRFHPQFYPEGVNVNIASIRNNNSIFMRTFERGVEDETLSCGSGAVAVGLAGFLHGKVKPPIKVEFHHGEVEIDFGVAKKEVFNIKLIGKASFVFSGNIFLEKRL